MPSPPHLTDQQLADLAHLRLEPRSILSYGLHLLACTDCRRRLETLFPDEAGRRLSWLLERVAPLPELGVSLESLHPGARAAADKALSEAWETLRDLELGAEAATALLQLPFQQAMLSARNRTWTGGAVLRLLGEMETLWFSDPLRALEIARLGELVSQGLQTREEARPGMTAILQARSQIFLANSLRVAGDLTGAEEAFHKSVRALRLAGDPPALAALHLNCSAALRVDQERFADALLLNEKAEQLYQKAGDQDGVWIIQLRTARVLTELKRLEEAIALFLRLCQELSEAGDQQALLFRSRQNLALAYLEAGEPFRAAAEIPKLEALAEEVAIEDLDEIKVSWLQGRIAEAEADPERAETLYRRVRRAYVSKALVYDAALVCLDLAALYLREDRLEDAHRLALEMKTLFDLQGLHPEATTALLMVRKALEEKAASTALVMEVATYLRRHPRGGGISIQSGRLAPDDRAD